MGGGGGGGSSKPRETAAEQAAAQTAKANWAQYKKLYVPLENKMIERINDKNYQEGQKQQAAGIANADVAKIEGAIPTDPNTGAAMSFKTVDPLAKAGQAGATGAVQGVEDAKVNAMQGMIDLGRGQQAAAQSGFDEIARGSVDKEIARAGNAAAQNSGMNQGVGAAIGMLGYKALGAGDTTDATKPQ